MSGVPIGLVRKSLPLVAVLAFKVMHFLDLSVTSVV